jgi:hypothetical protein
VLGSVQLAYMGAELGEHAHVQDMAESRSCHAWLLYRDFAKHWRSVAETRYVDLENYMDKQRRPYLVW